VARGSLTPNRFAGGTVDSKSHSKNSASLPRAAAIAFASLAAIAGGLAPAHGQDASSPNAATSTEPEAAPAPARDAQAMGDGGVPALQEVIVTAQRRSQSLQRVPVAMSAIDQSSLQRHDVQTLSDLQLLVPSAYVSGYSHGEGQQFFSLRGQSESGLNTGGGAGGGAAVVGYFSEVPTQMAGPGLYYDLASVQVLNGPQGTLFGRNTTGGAVLFEPQAPDFNGIHGYVQALGGDYRRAETQAAVNLPLIGGVLALRLAGQIGSREGYTRDVNTGVDYDNRHFRSGRAELLFRPSDSFEDYFIGSYVDFDEHGPGAILDAANPANIFVGAGILSYLDAQNARGVRATALSVRELDQETDYSFINKMTLRLGDDLKLRNITSYSRQLARRDDDEDGTALALLDSLGSRPGTYLVDEGTLTEELQLQGTTADKALNWQTGVYYEDDYTPGALNHTYTQHEVLLPVYANTDSTDLGGTSTGVYGQAAYNLTPVLEGLSVTAGYRYTWDHAYEGYSQSFGLTPFYPAAGDGCSSRSGVYPDCFIAAGARHSGGSYTFGFAYQASAATMLYVTTRQGYKSGGFNLVAASIGATSSPYFSYGPEKVQDVELGIKSDWSLGKARGRTDLAIYDSRLRNAQVNTSALIDNQQEAVTTNAAKATVKGIEIQNVLRPGDDIELTLSYSYMDAYYDRYVTPLGENLTGLPYAFAPRNKGSVIGRVRLPVPSVAGAIWLGADLSYQDRVFAGFTTVDPGSYMPSYGLLGVRADWTEVWGSRFDAALFVTNATNKAYRITNEDLYSTIGTATTGYGPPRMFGASVRYQF
jgi:iron complex outermembrane recepter protein